MFLVLTQQGRGLASGSSRLARISQGDKGENGQGHRNEHLKHEGCGGCCLRVARAGKWGMAWSEVSSFNPEIGGYFLSALWHEPLADVAKLGGQNCTLKLGAFLDGPNWNHNIVILSNGPKQGVTCVKVWLLVWPICGSKVQLDNEMASVTTLPRSLLCECPWCTGRLPVTRIPGEFPQRTQPGFIMTTLDPQKTCQSRANQKTGKILCAAWSWAPTGHVTYCLL